MNIINTVKNAAFNTALTSTLHYLEKAPEINIPKAMDLIDKVVPDGWYESQRAAFHKGKKQLVPTYFKSLPVG